MRKTGILAATVAAAALLAACNGSAGSEDPGTTAGGPGGGEATITIDGFSYTGAETVDVGTTVTVTNEDSFAHTWTSQGAFDSGTLSEGDVFEFTFEEPGEYDYICTIHPTQMSGTITVEA